MIIKNTIVETKLDNHLVCLSHCPMLSWEKRTHGVLHFFGHIHSNPFWNPVKCTLNSYDVGVDNNAFRPISLADAIVKATNPTNKLIF